jgi:hypothetical protein
VEIIITEWALNSYLELKMQHAFSDEEYWQKIRPDVLLLKNYPSHPRFAQSNFWSQEFPNGYKMKWHQMGNGKVQIRLPVGLLDSAYLCEAYVKESPKQEARKLARFKTHLQLIRLKQFTERGRLS